MYTEQKSYEPLDTETTRQRWRLRFCRLTPQLVACLMFVIFIAIIIGSTTGDNRSCGAIIFLFRDAGEYYSLLPLLKYFRSNNDSILGIVINGGTAPSDATKNEQDVVLLSEFIPEVEKGLARNETFKYGEQLAQLLAGDQILGQNHGKCICISGLVSQNQIDIVRAFKTTFANIETIGYSDGFNDWASNTWADIAMKTAIEDRSVFDRLWLNAKSIKDEAKKSLGKLKTTKNLRIQVVGDTSFLQWQSTALENASFYREVRNYMYSSKLRSSANCFGVLYFGGYGEGYYESVEVFANAVRNISDQQHARVTTGYDPTVFCFAFVAHPGISFNTKKEENIFKKVGASVKILSRSKYATPFYAKASNATLSQGSSCGPQSISIGIPSLFTQSSNNIFQSSGFIPVASNATSLEKWLLNMRFTHGRLPGNLNCSNPGLAVLHKLGIPQNPLERCVKDLA